MSVGPLTAATGACRSYETDIRPRETQTLTQTAFWGTAAFSAYALASAVAGDGRQLSLFNGGGWNGRVAIFDLDETLLTLESLPSFLRELARQDPRLLKRLGYVRRFLYLTRAAYYGLVYKLGIQIDEPGITRFATMALRDFFPDLDYRYASPRWFEAIGREKLNQVVVGELNALRQAGYRVILASSSLDVLVREVARHLRIDEADVIYSETELGDQGELRRLKNYRQGKRKATVVEARLLQLEDECRIATGRPLDRANSWLYTDSLSDLPIKLRCKIGNLTAVGPRLDAYLRANGGRRILTAEGGVVIDRYQRISHRRWEPKPEKVLGSPRVPREARAFGRWLIPTQWLVGDLLSESIYQRQLCLTPSREALISFSLFSGAAAGGETVARGIYNYFRHFPLLYAGPDVRGGVVGGVLHTAGGLCGMISMELYHNRGSIRWGDIIDRTLTQLGCWTITRGLTIFALQAARVRIVGNPFVQLAEMIAFPAVEMLLMKWRTAWNYRPAPCSS